MKARVFGFDDDDDNDNIEWFISMMLMMLHEFDRRKAELPNILPDMKRDMLVIS